MPPPTVGSQRCSRGSSGSPATSWATGWRTSGAAIASTFAIVLPSRTERGCRTNPGAPHGSARRSSARSAIATSHRDPKPPPGPTPPRPPTLLRAPRPAGETQRAGLAWCARNAAPWSDRAPTATAAVPAGRGHEPRSYTGLLSDGAVARDGAPAAPGYSCAVAAPLAGRYPSRRYPASTVVRPGPAPSSRSCWSAWARTPRQPSTTYTMAATPMPMYTLKSAP